jgi:hypothetical protein
VSEGNADDFVALPFEGVQATQAVAYDIRDFPFEGMDDGEGSGSFSSYHPSRHFLAPEMSLELR